MARKQETPAATTEAKDLVSTLDSSSGAPEAADSRLSPSGERVQDPGDAGAPAAVPGPSEGTASATSEGQAVPGTGADAATDEQGANSSLPTIGGAATEGTSLAASDLADSTDVNQVAPADQAGTNPNPNPATLRIYPLRSYMDEGELRRRGGPAYTVPRRHAEELVQRKLASLQPLKE